MATDPQLRSQMRQIVWIAVPGAVDLAGQVSTVSAATFVARVEPYFREVMVGGVIEKTTHFITMPDDVGTTITETQMRNAQIWLPGTDPVSAPNEVRRAVVVHYCPDEQGLLDHIEVRV